MHVDGRSTDVPIQFIQYSSVSVTTHLERTQISPGQLPGQQLPQDQAKRVHISSRAVCLVRDNLAIKHKDGISMQLE